MAIWQSRKFLMWFLPTKHLTWPLKQNGEFGCILVIITAIDAGEQCTPSKQTFTSQCVFQHSISDQSSILIFSMECFNSQFFSLQLRIWTLNLVYIKYQITSIFFYILRTYIGKYFISYPWFWKCYVMPSLNDQIILFLTNIQFSIDGSQIRELRYVIEKNNNWNTWLKKSRKSMYLECIFWQMMHGHRELDEKTIQ